MTQSRRQFLPAVPAIFPAVLPRRVFGSAVPSNHIRIGQIGCGRIARGHDMAAIFRYGDIARIVAVCDVDSVRLADGKELVESSYERQFGKTGFEPVKACADYHEILADKSIDAVCISLPDHWHAQPAIEAALAGKDIYLQKPASLTISEGRQMADVVAKTGRILQIGSQQRSDAHFRLACGLVRNGRIGKLIEILIGLPEDPAGGEEPEMPVPPNLNYDAWLGSTPVVYYTEKRVHPQTPDIRARYARPGWLRCEQFGAGMITGWGAHHVDTAHWAMGTEDTGPVEIAATAEFPKKGLWDVHGAYSVRAKYANGVTVYISEKYPNGLRFIGEDGWIWVTRGEYKPGDPAPGQPRSKAIDASDLRMLREGTRDSEVHLHASAGGEHHRDWLESIRTRRPPAAPAEAGHRACSACLLAHAAMKLGRTLRWDPAKERFENDAEADALLSRPQRAPYGTDRVLERAAAARG